MDDEFYSLLYGIASALHSVRFNTCYSHPTFLTSFQHLLQAYSTCYNHPTLVTRSESKLEN